MLLSIFGDESSDEKQQRVFSISGVIGTASEWERVTAAWLLVTKGEEFHAADWEMAGRSEEILHLSTLLGIGIVAGISFSLDLVAHKKVFPEMLRDTGYFHCLGKVLHAHATTAFYWNNKVSSDPSCDDPLLELEFTFDHRKISEGNAGTLYSAFINQPEWRNTSLLSSKISFDCRTNPRLQIADLVAREAMLEADRKFNKRSIPQRRQFKALQSNGAFKFQELGMKYFLDLEKELACSGDEPGYWKWLSETGRVQHGKPQDNYGNRFSYFNYLMNKERLERKKKVNGKAE